MTKVKELIKNSTFIKAKGFDDLKPEVSIFLPTYKRGDNGLFERTLKSLLAQSFTNFELIIIDDASVDSTASIYKKYMENDARIAVIRHENNLGLAAVSEVEAFLKSRGQKILCAFDDNDFTKDGIEALVKDQQDNPGHLITYGQVKLFLSDNESEILGTEHVDYYALASCNRIGHSSVLVDRSVFDDVGFYDPHFAVMRFWDWDLWLRAAQKYAFYKIDRLIVSEYGVTQPDSLGNTTGCDFVSVRIWMQRYRNDLLRFENIEDYEFDNLPEYTGSYFKNVLAEIVGRKFGNKYPLVSQMVGDDGYILLTSGVYTVSLSLVFEVFRDRVVFASFNDLNENFAEYISGAKAVIFCRDIPSPDICHKLALFEKDYYYYTDDNLFIIPEMSKVYTSQYTMEFVENAKEILASTECLAEELRNMFHKKTRVVTCVCPYSLQQFYQYNISKFKDFSCLRIGWCSIGKEEGLIAMKKDLESLALKSKKKIKIFCVAFKDAQNVLRDAFSSIKNVELIFNDVEFNYTYLLNKMKCFDPHFLIHTHSSQWAQIYKYKTYNYLLTAWYLNAVPFITVRPPYDEIQNNPEVGSLIVKNGNAVTEGIFCCMENGVSYVEEILANIKKFWDYTYPLNHNRFVLQDLLEENKTVSIQKIFSLLKYEPQRAEKGNEAKKLCRTISKTFSYYIKGKPKKYCYPVRYNMAHLRKEFKSVLKYYKNKFLKKRRKRK